MSREWIHHRAGNWHTVSEPVRLFLADDETYIIRPRMRHFSAVDHGACWTLYEHRYGGGKKNTSDLVCTGLKSLRLARAALQAERPAPYWATVTR